MGNEIELIKIIAYFCIYSLFGWIMESVLKTYMQKKPVNSGFLYGPFCPIYGFGAVIMFLFLQGFKDNIVLLFIIAFLVLSIWEYIVGWLLEKVFHTTYWDYTENRCNINGKVCLMNSLFWGFLGVIFIRYMHPFFMEKIDLIPRDILVFVTSIIGLAILVDAIISAIKVSNLKTKLEKLKEMSNSIKEKIEELDTKSITKVNKENLQQMIDELKYKQIRLKRRLLKQTNRLKKAFPTIKSDALEKLNEFLKEKKENSKKGKE